MTEIENLELQLCVAMAASPETYHEALSLGADKILQTADAAYCIQQFDPITGAFDDTALLGQKELLANWLHLSAEIAGPVGSFRLRRIIQRIRAAYQQARLISTANQHHDDPQSQLSAMSSCVLELGTLADNGASEAREIQDGLADIDRRAEGKSGGDVIQWPVDWMQPFGPIGKQEFIVIGGRPGSGKSALMGQVAYEYAKAGHTVMFISLEMSRNEVWHRFTSIECGFSLRRVENNDLRHRRYRKVFENIATSKRILLREHYSIGAIISAISRERLRGLDAVFIDYLQLIIGDRGKSRLEQLSDITRQIKLTAKDLRTPIFCGSQLNRQSEHHEVPSLSSLRESGTIEQDADRVILIHETEGRHELIQAKCRNGPRAAISSKFIGETTSFEKHTIV